MFKTRSLATDACRAGSVTIDGRDVKPARELRPGETVHLRQGVVLRTLVMRDAPATRVAAKAVALYCTDLTPASEFEKARAQPVVQFLARAKGSGRPTKRDRRLMDRLRG